MTIASTDRKLLWARAYNSCALCKTELTGDADSAALAGIVYGEEAQIVARSIDGPRGRSGDRSAIDAYFNFVLLCAKDHKKIDDQPDFFTLEKVQSMKLDHEKWAREKFNGLPAPEPIRVIRGENESEVPLEPMITGEAVWALVAQAHMYNVRPPGDEFGAERADLADAFLTTARDWGDIHDAVETQGLHAVAHLAADPKASRATVSVTNVVDGLYRDAELSSEIAGRQYRLEAGERVQSVHAR